MFLASHINFSFVSVTILLAILDKISDLESLSYMIIGGSWIFVSDLIWVVRHCIYLLWPDFNFCITNELKVLVDHFDKTRPSGTG